MTGRMLVSEREGSGGFAVVVLAERAQPPERHFRLVNHEAVGRHRIEARLAALGAVDIGDPAAATTDDVVMVVTGPRLEQGRASRRFDPAGEPRPGQRAEDVVDGLGGDRVQLDSHELGDLVNIEMPMGFIKNFEHGESGTRDPQPPCPQHFLAGHISITPCGKRSLNSRSVLTLSALPYFGQIASLLSEINV